MRDCTLNERPIIVHLAWEEEHNKDTFSTLYKCVQVGRHQHTSFPLYFKLKVRQTGIHT